MEAIKELIRPELLVLIPVLYFIGVALKKSASISDKYIPLLLGATGIVLATVYLVSVTPFSSGSEIAALIFAGITQGVLCAGCSVYFNQIAKQTRKDDAA